MNTEETWHIPRGCDLTSHISTKVIGSFQHSLVARNVCHGAVVSAKDSAKKVGLEEEIRPERVKSLSTRDPGYHIHGQRVDTPLCQSLYQLFVLLRM